MDNGNGDHEPDGQQSDFSALIPWVLAGCEEGVLAEYDAVACRKAEDNGMHSNKRRRKKPWTPVGELEVDLVPCLGISISPLAQPLVCMQGQDSPPDRGSMHPYSSPTARPHHDIAAPTTHSVKLNPILPTDEAIAPGVANIPLPITLEIIMMNALDQWRVRPTTAVSGRTSSSRVRCSGNICDGAIEELLSVLSVDLRSSGVSTLASVLREGGSDSAEVIVAISGVRLGVRGNYIHGARKMVKLVALLCNRRIDKRTRAWILARPGMGDRRRGGNDIAMVSD